MNGPRPSGSPVPPSLRSRRSWEYDSPSRERRTSGSSAISNSARVGSQFAGSTRGARSIPGDRPATTTDRCRFDVRRRDTTQFVDVRLLLWPPIEPVALQQPLIDFSEFAGVWHAEFFRLIGALDVLERTGSHVSIPWRHDPRGSRARVDVCGSVRSR